MRIKVIFDKVAQNKKLNAGWGVSFLVNKNILFDTGEKGAYERVHAGEFLRLLKEMAPDEDKFYKKGYKEVEGEIRKKKRK